MLANRDIRAAPLDVIEARDLPLRVLAHPITSVCNESSIVVAVERRLDLARRCGLAISRPALRSRRRSRVGDVTTRTSAAAEREPPSNEAVKRRLSARTPARVRQPLAETAYGAGHTPRLGIRARDESHIGYLSSARLAPRSAGSSRARGSATAFLSGRPTVRDSRSLAVARSTLL